MFSRHSIVPPPEYSPYSTEASSSTSSSTSQMIPMRTQSKILSLRALQEIDNLKINALEITADSEFVVVVANDSRTRTKQLHVYGLKNNETFVLDGVQQVKYVRGNQFQFQTDGLIWETVAPRHSFSKPTKKFDLRNFSLELREIILSGKVVLSYCDKKHINVEVCPFTIILSHNSLMKTTIPGIKHLACTVSNNATLNATRYPVRTGEKIQYWLLDSLVLKCSGNTTVIGITVEAVMFLISTQPTIRNVKSNIVVSDTCQFKQRPPSLQLPKQVVFVSLKRSLSRPVVGSFNAITQAYRDIISGVSSREAYHARSFSSSSSSHIDDDSDEYYEDETASSSDSELNESFQRAQQEYHGPVSDLRDSFTVSDKEKKGKKPNFELSGKLDAEDVEKRNPEDIGCVICTINVAKAILTACGHNICIGCVKRMQYAKVGKVCPICRMKIDKAVIPVISSDRSSKTDLSFEITGDVTSEDKVAVSPTVACKGCNIETPRVVFSCGCKVCCLQCSKNLQKEISRCPNPDCKKEITFGIAIKI